MNLPAPRLQLRWRKPTTKEKNRKSHLGCDLTCVYELIIPLGEGDIRRRKKKAEMALEIGRTFVGTTCDNPDYSPFRDGAHAQWDGLALGKLPIFVISPDGSAHEKPYTIELPSTERT